MSRRVKICRFVQRVNREIFVSQSEPNSLQLVVSLASTGKLEQARERASAISDSETAASAWLAIARANANLQRWDEAHLALSRALEATPNSDELRLETARLLDQQGRADAALAILEPLAARYPGSPQVAGDLARALQFVGRAEEAANRLEAALAFTPTDAGLHRQLVELRWRLGAGELCTAVVERAIAAHPDRVPLWLVAADGLRHAGFSDRALALLERALARDPASPGLLTSAGVLLDELGRVDEGLARQRDAARLAPDSQVVKRNLVPPLLRAGAYREAMVLLDQLSATAPLDHLLVGWRGVALRLAGDPEYRRLCDYPRLVRVHDLVPTAEYPDIAAFNAAFARELGELHRVDRRPLMQSLRGGSQTERNLPRDPDRFPAIDAFFRMIDGPIREYIAALDPARSHPTDRLRRQGYRVSGSWSVRLKPGGFHTDHVHPQGWISSAYYVELPPAGEGREGWLKFGEPGMPAPPCSADHFVEPRAGRLVLFPSFLWHGTVPFTTGGTRLTAAFDVVPA